MTGFRLAVCAAGLCLALSQAPLVGAQTSPEQGTNHPTAAGSARVYTPTSLAVDWDVPRDRDGRPDLQGEVWAANFFTYLQGGANPSLTIPEKQQRAAYDRMIAGFLANPALALDPEIHDLIRGTEGFPLVRGERRTRLLVLPADGRMPFTAAARAEMQKGQAQILGGPANNPEERNAMERCFQVGAQPPLAALGAPVPIQFIQSPGHVVIHAEYHDDARVIPFAAAGSTKAGSVARWEGDTLVVETTGLPAWQKVRGLPVFVVTSEAKVIERFTRVTQEELLYQFTVEDPSMYAAPWLAEYSFYRAPYRMFPSTCHEGNYGLPNILRGQRVIDARAAAKR